MDREVLMDLLKGSDISKISFTKAKVIFDYLTNGLEMYCGAEIQPSRVITRVRVHLDNEDFFYTEIDLSYHPNNEKILNYSRCALPFYSLFYGAIDFDKYNNQQIEDSSNAKKLLIGTPMFESELGNLVLQSGKPIRFSIGYWELKQPLDAIFVVFNENAKIFARYLKEEKENFKKIIQMDKKLPQEYIYKFLSFISYEFSKSIKSHEEYKFSALYSKMVLFEKMKDAIVYPSVKTETEGLCIAIKPSIIEEKCSFSQVQVCEAYQTNENQIKVIPIYVGKTSDNDILNTDINYKMIESNFNI